MHRPRLLAALCSAAALITVAQAAPYIPSSGNEVIERLPSRQDPAQRELKQLRTRLAASPTDLEVATRLAMLYIELSRSESDPRYLGYAEAALSPWWKQKNPPAEVRVLRATILQSRHQFRDALADLEQLLKADPGNAQGWLTRATILQVLGEYEEARASCGRLGRLAPDLVAATCLAGVASLNGKAEQAYAVLSQALAADADSGAGIRGWAVTLLAEIAARLGKEKEAERHFRQALALDRSDGYLLAAYADYLLDQNRPAEVVALLKNHIRADGLLLRYALALHALGSPEAGSHIGMLRSRFAAAALRGDTLHEREQARFELHLQGDREAALRLAQQNWKVQKEPADARVLLEAAHANADKAAAAPVLAWLQKNQVQDRSLAALTRKLEAAE